MDQEGQLREVGLFKRGQPNGAFRLYREDVSLEVSSFFKNGVQQGTAYEYNQQSQPIKKTEYVDSHITDAQIIDSAAQKQAKQERAAEWKAMQSFKIAR